MGDRELRAHYAGPDLDRADRGSVVTALVAPFAERLGFDAVLATRWATKDGSYTGEIDGPLVWGRGKLEAVRGWAAEVGVSLRSSYAYSDS